MILDRRQFLKTTLLGMVLTGISPRHLKVYGQSVPPSNLDAALEHLAEQMDRFHKIFDVYTDVGAAGNHFVMLGKIASNLAAVEIDPCSVEGPHSGATAIKNIFRNTGGNWGGWYFLNGVLLGDERQPTANWGDVPNAGIDLRGATQLTFWARGATGGEKIEFFMGGVGWNPETVPPTKTKPFPDSTPRIPSLGTTVTLTPNWTKYTIDLSGADLSYVLGGFAWVAAAAANPEGAVFWIDDIQYNKPRLEEPRFIVSYVTIPSNHPFDTVLRNVAFTYDNAITMLAFMARGTDDDWRRARLIADAFVYAQEHDRFYEDGRLRNGYQAGDLALPPGWAPNGKVGTVRMPGFWDCTKQQWFEDRFQVSTHTGNVAWPMIALITYYQKKGGAQYLEAARLMGEWIEDRRQDMGFGGYRGGFEGWEKSSTDFPDDPVEVPWASTEHNLDIFVAFTKMFQVTGDCIWRDRAAYARAFVEKMWDHEPYRGCFLTGTKDAHALNPDVLPLDVQAWSVLALPDALDKFPSVLQCAEIHHLTEKDAFRGFDFNEDRDGVWFEGTAHMVGAYTKAGQKNKAAEFINQLRLAQSSASNANGKGLVAASHDGVTTGFKQINGKDDLLLFSRLHIAATGWQVFAELGANPYGLFPTPSLNEIIIVSPRNGARVSSPVDIRGRVRNLRCGEAIWVLIRDPLGQWWVQRPPMIRRNGTWLVRRACVGEARDTGREFVIYAVITTQSLSCGQVLGAPPDGPSASRRVVRTRRWSPCPACP